MEVIIQRDLRNVFYCLDVDGPGYETSVCEFIGGAGVDQTYTLHLTQDGTYMVRLTTYDGLNRELGTDEKDVMVGVEDL